ncbi:M24 family metallopeptidase C-terminal domain-containing protein [Viridibacillus arvi]|uniref:Peptidase M24 C-terminal domain-containing protein n=1 Tax=Viridibacillus arvi TaxID=263475 RepID=A0A0M0LLX3_9BACL|nr:M24 family metallopeptidase C-terminal domain-containing protein [Viridibacillus arvi]KOO52075.1 hypothetical protein AMD00_06575 [Viridibacillus arvi]
MNNSTLFIRIFLWRVRNERILEGINKDMLTESEKQWLNNYHQEVYTKLAPYFNEEESGWLREETREI